jgi:hypothetical protein
MKNKDTEVISLMKKAARKAEQVVQKRNVARKAVFIQECEKCLLRRKGIGCPIVGKEHRFEEADGYYMVDDNGMCKRRLEYLEMSAD